MAEADLLLAIEAFLQEEQKLAHRNQTSLRGTEKWTSPDSVPVDEIRKRFSGYGDVVRDDETVVIPLHERDSGELTGEYVEYNSGGLLPCYIYYDIGSQSRRRIDIAKFSETALAWQLRFWSSQFDLPSPPSYLSTSGSGSDSGQAGASDLDMGHIQTVVEPTEAYTSEEQTAFFDSLKDFVGQQQERDRTERQEAFDRLSARSYVGQHGGMYNALPLRQFFGSERGSMLKIAVSEELQSRENVNIRGTCDVFKGSEVLINLQEDSAIELPDTHTTSLPAVGEVVEIGSRTITVSLSPGHNDAGAKQALRYLFDKDSTLLKVGVLHNPVPYQRELSAIQYVRDHPDKRATIVGNGPVEFDSPHSVTGSFPELNEFQTEAAARAVVANEVALIHGPPGTGKTRTLVSLIKHFVRNGDRVLACAHSNQATDNLLVGTSSIGHPDPDSLHAAASNEQSDINIARAGNNTSSQVVKQEYFNVPAGSANVVGATMSAAAKFEPDSFDVAIIDEASQASIPATLIPVQAASKVVLAGDHKQLPPYASDELDENEMEISLFEHFIERYGEQVATLLKRQYRMHEQIAAFSSREFYNGALETADQNREWTIGEHPPVEAIHVEGSEARASGHSYRNESEAELVAEHVESLLEEGVDSGDIGVITAYRGQIGTIRSQLGGIEGHGGGVKVDTVDSFQGGEREAIIVSFVRSNNEGRAGFLTFPDEGKRRLNVALTRARKRLTLVGNFETLRSPENREDCTATYDALVQYLRSIDALSGRSPAGDVMNV